ncbi:MAG: hypothetical protein EA360_11615, partial [Balneolaceae bacterium]
MAAITDIYIGSFIAVQLLFIAGYMLNRYCLTDLDRGYHFILALPVGVLLWGIIWSVASLIHFDYLFGFGSLLNQFSLLAFLFTAISLSVLSIYSLPLQRQELIHIGLWSGTILFLSLLFLVNSYIVISGDSYVFMNWAQDPLVTLRRGFPLILLSIANLSSLISTDYYLFIIHPLIFLSLTLLIGQVSLSLISKYLHTFKADFVYPLLLLFLFIFAMNPMMYMNMIYINGHVLFTISYLAIFAIILLSKTFSPGKILYIALLSLSVTMLRMEGFLMLLPLFAITLFGRDRRVNFKLLSAVLGFSVLYLSNLIFHFWDSGFVHGAQYLIMILLAVLLTLLLTNRFLSLKVQQHHFWMVLLLLSLSLYLVMVLIKPGHMLESLTVFLRNLATPGTWGALIVIPSFLMSALLIYRFKNGLKIRDHDLLLFLFLISVLIILMLGFFRQPYRPGRFDSANRMLFHFLPFLVIWVTVELNRV